MDDFVKEVQPKVTVDDVSHGKWVSSLQDDRAGIYSTTECTALSMLSDDGEVKLLVAHSTTKFDTMLTAFKGVNKFKQAALVDQPVAIATFQNEQNSSPAIAVASGPSILCYKNLKPFYKFTPNGQELHPIELEAWKKTKESVLTAEQLHTVIENLSDEIPLRQLTPLSQSLLALPEEEWKSFVDHHSEKDFRNLAPLTCMTTMKKSTAENLDFLVIGTERGEVSVIDGQAFVQKETVLLPSVPTGIVAYGFYDVDFRIFVATRSSQIYCMKRGSTSAAKPIIITSSTIVCFTRLNKMLVVACADHTLAFYSFRGKRLTITNLGEPILSLLPFFYQQKQVSAVLVLLDNEVRMYNEEFLIDILKIGKSLKWFRYGPFGREEAALILGTKEGGLIVRLLRRRADFEKRVNTEHPLEAHMAKLAIPKKTRAFVDQALREKEQTMPMNQTYQTDMFLTRHRITKEYAKMASTAAATLATDKQEEVDIAVDVTGFGPKFRVTVRLNSSAPGPLFQMFLSFLGKDLYAFEKNMIPVSALFPGHFYTFTTLVTCLKPENGIAGEIRVFLNREGRPLPIVSAVVGMPVSAMSFLD